MNPAGVGIGPLWGAAKTPVGWSSDPRGVKIRPLRGRATTPQGWIVDPRGVRQRPHRGVAWTPEGASADPGPLVARPRRPAASYPLGSGVVPSWVGAAPRSLRRCGAPGAGSPIQRYRAGKPARNRSVPIPPIDAPFRGNPLSHRGFLGILASGRSRDITAGRHTNKHCSTEKHAP